MSLVGRVSLKFLLLWDIVDPSSLGAYRRVSRPVDGWLTRNEEELLFRLARQVPEGQAIVELGSWFGRSAILLAGGSREGNRAKVYAVDLFQAAGCAQDYLEERAGETARDFWDVFRSNMDAAGVSDLVEPVRQETAKAGDEWDGSPVGLIFLDADHSYEGVKRDWDAWHHRLVPGGKIAFHDYQNQEYEVTRFVDELVAAGRLKVAEQQDSILVGEPVHEPAG